MKIGDVLMCNDGETTVELLDFDKSNIFVKYKGNIHKRLKSDIGKTLHYENHCWSCASKVSSRFCVRCDYCGWYICAVCGSCHQGQCVYHAYGFDENGIHRNGTRFSEKGYDFEGYDRDGFNNVGIDRQGYDRSGFDCNGYNREGFDKAGYNCYGYDMNGFDRRGFNNQGIHLNGTRYSDEGYDREGYNRAGFSREGYDKNGRDQSGYDLLGYDPDGYDKNGYNAYGCDRHGYNRLGYDKYGYDADGFDRHGYDKNGIMRSTWLDEYWRSLNTNRIWYKMKDGSKKRGTIKKCYSEYIDVVFDNGETYNKINYRVCIEKGIIGPIRKQKKTQTNSIVFLWIFNVDLPFL